MDNLEFYRQTIETVLRKYAEIPYAYGEIEQYLIIDKEHNHFMLFDVGWQQKRRVHGCVTHVQIIDDKIWIQRDGIEDGITDELVEAGISKDKIVLGFQPPNVRPHTAQCASSYRICDRVDIPVKCDRSKKQSHNKINSQDSRIARHGVVNRTIEMVQTVSATEVTHQNHGCCSTFRLSVSAINQ